jgi:hypothetical protein
MVDADGAVLGSYRKSHIPEGPGYHEKFYFSPGDTGFKVFDTRFAKLGVAICWDQWFPEAARCMALMGAEILLYPTAIGSEPQDASIDSSAHWQRTMQGHAAANVMPLVASNRIGTEQGEKYTMTFYGSSFIASPTGEKVAEADRVSETVLTAPSIWTRCAAIGRPGACSAIGAPICTTRCCRSMDAAEDGLTRDLPPPRSGIRRLETTGGNAAHHRITEVGIVRVRTANWSRNGVRWSIRNADSPYIEALHRHHQRDGGRCAALRRDRGAGARETARRGVRRAQRALRLRVPAHRVSPLDVHFSAQVLCTVKLSRRLFPSSCGTIWMP